MATSTMLQTLFCSIDMILSQNYSLIIEYFNLVILSKNPHCLVNLLLYNFFVFTYFLDKLNKNIYLKVFCVLGKRNVECFQNDSIKMNQGTNLPK